MGFNIDRYDIWNALVLRDVIRFAWTHNILF